MTKRYQHYIASSWENGNKYEEYKDGNPCMYLGVKCLEEHGWEIVALDRHGGEIRYYMKREVE